MTVDDLRNRLDGLPGHYIVAVEFLPKNALGHVPCFVDLDDDPDDVEVVMDRVVLSTRTMLTDGAPDA